MEVKINRREFLQKIRKHNRINPKIKEIAFEVQQDKSFIYTLGDWYSSPMIKEEFNIKPSSPGRIFINGDLFLAAVKNMEQENITIKDEGENITVIGDFTVGLSKKVIYPMYIKDYIEENNIEDKVIEFPAKLFVGVFEKAAWTYFRYNDSIQKLMFRASKGRIVAIIENAMMVSGYLLDRRVINNDLVFSMYGDSWRYIRNIAGEIGYNSKVLIGDETIVFPNVMSMDIVLRLSPHMEPDHTWLFFRYDLGYRILINKSKLRTIIEDLENADCSSSQPLLVVQLKADKRIHEYSIDRIAEDAIVNLPVGDRVAIEPKNAEGVSIVFWIQGFRRAIMELWDVSNDIIFARLPNIERNVMLAKDAIDGGYYCLFSALY